MATVIRLLRRFGLTGRRLVFHRVTDELPDTYVTRSGRRIPRKAA